MAIMVRDALEAVLLAGIKAWGLQISNDAVRDGVRCWEDDSELLTAANCLNVPGDALSNLPGMLERHPGILESKESHQAFQNASQGQVERMATEISEVLSMLERTLRDEVDPDYFSSVLGTLVYLAMDKFCPQRQKATRLPALPDGTSDYPLTRYAGVVASGGWRAAKEVYAQVIVTELGRLIDKVVRRQARRAFTMLAVGDRQALAMLLALIIEEVKNAHCRTDSCVHEVHEEEAG